MVILKNLDLLPVITSKLDENAVSIAKKLHDFQERRIFIVNNKNHPVGIISLVDINDRVVARGKNPNKTIAKDIMTYPINLIADINESAEDLIKKMVQKDNYYIPVTEKGILKGLITYSHLIKALKK